MEICNWQGHEGTNGMDDTSVHMATGRRGSTGNWEWIQKLEGLVNMVNWNQRWAQILFLFTSPWSEWDCVLCSCPTGLCLHAVPSAAWIRRYLWKREEQNSCRLPDAKPESSHSCFQVRVWAFSSRALHHCRWGICPPCILQKICSFLIGETALILVTHAALQWRICSYRFLSL